MPVEHLAETVNQAKGQAADIAAELDALEAINTRTLDLGTFFSHRDYAKHLRERPMKPDYVSTTRRSD